MDYSFLSPHLGKVKYQWLVTGAAGFIGSHLCQALLSHQQTVVGLDNFSTGKRDNLDQVRQRIGERNLKNFTFIEADIRDLSTLSKQLKGVDFCLHQAALGSVPRSLVEPMLYLESNIVGFVNVLEFCRHNGIKKLVYASSSSVYGDNVASPKMEQYIGEALSPYALTKQINEKYAAQYSLSYGLASVGLRYFNVFGPRQDPEGAYAAVIPKWISQMLKGGECVVYGDGSTSRDFCFVSNVVLANVLAALSQDMNHQVYNVAHGGKTSLTDLFNLIASGCAAITKDHSYLSKKPRYENFRKGDIAHSLASIEKISNSLSFSPVVDLKAGLEVTIKAYLG